MMPCSKKFFLAAISPKNVGERGEGGEVEKKFFRSFKKGAKKFFRTQTN
jgi:hypothetical protein